MEEDIKRQEITEEQRELYRQQARSRAGSKVYQLVRQNDLSIMWTLTYEKEVTDRAEALQDFNLFIKRLSYHLNQKIRYVAVTEVQKKRYEKTGKPVLHFHLAIDKQYINKHQLQEIWSHGVVWFSKYPDGTPIPKDRRSVAQYLSKYLKKDMEDNPELAGRKMYLNSHGLKLPNNQNGIISDKTLNDLKIAAKEYEIKGRDDIKGYEINFRNKDIFPFMPDTVELEV